MFSINKLPNGALDKRKSRIVTKGYDQSPSFDFFRTFSPVVKYVTTCIILTVTLTNCWSMHQLDINNDFLNGELTKEVYMTQLQGFKDHLFQKYVCKLKKVIYGFK